MHRIDLSGTWRLVRVENGESLPAMIPGDNLSALVSEGIVPDPYFGSNELLVQWVGREDWSFERVFDLNRSMVDDATARSALYLHFDSIDTIAEVRLNDVVVGTSDNMFVRRRFPIGAAAKAGENCLSVLIRSPERTAATASARLSYPHPHSEYPVQSPHRNLIRKVQCHGGWDWGPCLMVSGIYGAVYVGAPAWHRIEYVTTRQQQFEASRWEIGVTVEINARRAGRTGIRVALCAPGGRANPVASAEAKLALAPGMSSQEIALFIDAPELWWPAGYGEQPLYELTVETEDDRVMKQIGFRRLETVVEDDGHGRSMHFRVNGRDVFSKGANWIPSDALPARHTEESYRRLLTAARAANMNTIRVWGGGQYEADAFYDLCDELGLLVWQDFMFSCSTYPANPPFLSTVSEEVVHQVKRLKDHPCLALWCGNNENLGALTWFPETIRRRDRYLVDYDRLYEGTIGSLVTELDRDRTYWPSSPSGGRGDYSDNWHDDTKGDMHFWSVWHEGKPFDAYYEVTPRFCSEFGFQSFPSPSSVAGYTEEAERNLTSPQMEHHQRNPRGNAIIIESLCRYFRFPEGFANMLYMSQVQQAVAIRTAVEYWRSQRPVCMGALYWQLNDNWPVASWSSLEYSGKWKLLHYVARRFFAPVHVLGFVKDGTFEVWVCNDTAAERSGECTVAFLDFDGTIVREDRFPVEASADASTRVGRYPIRNLPAEPHELFATMEFRSADSVVSNDTFLTYPKRCTIRKAVVSTEVTVDTSSFVISLSASSPAFFVSLDAGSVPGRFDDNCITLVPGKRRQLRFFPADSAPSGDGLHEGDRGTLERSLSVHHLADSYR